MSLAISPQTEALLTEEARRQDISVDALLRKLIDARLSPQTPPRREAPRLPVWRLGATGPFHRRDIYDDVA